MCSVRESRFRDCLLSVIVPIALSNNGVRWCWLFAGFASNERRVDEITGGLTRTAGVADMRHNEAIQRPVSFALERGRIDLVIVVIVIVHIAFTTLLLVDAETVRVIGSAAYEPDAVVPAQELPGSLWLESDHPRRT